MGKKKKSELDKQFADFEAGMVGNGYSAAAVKVLWDTLMPFADYAFNKAHSAGYGVLSYWTAYLKANYPAEYMAALLTSVGDSKDKLGMYLNECRRMGIKVLAPDVNESFVDFTAVPTAEGATGIGDIRFGLGAVRNVGANVVEGIRSAREAKGRFESFHDFLAKVPLQVTNKRTVESLIKAGAFDSLGSTRRALLEIHEDAVDGSVNVKRTEATGQAGFDFDSLFDEPQETSKVPDRPEWAKRDKLAFEREMLGLYVSDHPLAGLEVALAKHASATITDLLAGEVAGDGEHVTVAGLITSVQHRVAKNSGNQYGIISVEDFGAQIDVMFLGKAYQEFAPELVNDSVVVIRGRVSMRDDGMNLHGSSLMVPELGQSGVAGSITISLPDTRATPPTIRALKEMLLRHKGDGEVRLRLTKGDTGRIYEVPYSVQTTGDFFGELKSLLGPGCLV